MLKSVMKKRSYHMLNKAKTLHSHTNSPLISPRRRISANISSHGSSFKTTFINNTQCVEPSWTAERPIYELHSYASSLAVQGTHLNAWLGTHATCQSLPTPAQLASSFHSTWYTYLLPIITPSFHPQK
jgi:hypothetical protein